MIKFDKEINYKGKCFQAAYDLAYDNKYIDYVVHGWVFLHQEWFVHAWCEFGDFVIDLTRDLKIDKKASYYEYFQIKEEGLIKYSLLVFLGLVLEHKYRGPWDKELFPDNEVNPPWLR